MEGWTTLIFQAWCKKFHIGQNWEKCPQMHDPAVQPQKRLSAVFPLKLPAGRAI